MNCKNMFRYVIESLKDGVKMWLDCNRKSYEFELSHKVFDKIF